MHLSIHLQNGYKEIDLVKRKNLNQIILGFLEIMATKYFINELIDIINVDFRNYHN